MSDHLILDRNAGPPVHAITRRRGVRFVSILSVLALGVVFLVGARMQASRSETGGHGVTSSTPPMHRGMERHILAAAIHSSPSSRALNTTLHAAYRSGPIERMVELQKTLAERRKLWEAEQAGIAACMADRGFEYGQLPYDDSTDLEYERARLKPSDVDSARTLGYGIVRDMEETARQQREEAAHGGPSLTPGPQFSAAYRGALMGPDPQPGQSPGDGWGSLEIPGGGQISWYRDSCLSRAREGVYGEDYAAQVLDLAMSDLESEIQTVLTNDAAYRAGLDRWRKCMAESGYTYTAPRAAMRALADQFHEGRLNIDELRRVEIDTAMADAHCYQVTGIGELLVTVRERAERVVLSREQDKAQARRLSLDNAVARAQAMLDSEPGSQSAP